MQVTDITTAETVFYAVGVKGAKNRKVFLADSSSCGNKAIVLHLAELVAADNPTTKVFLVDAKDRTLTMRDSHRTPLASDAIYAGIEDEDDVNMDELSDDEL